MPRDVSLSDSKCWNGGQKCVKGFIPAPQASQLADDTTEVEEREQRLVTDILQQLGEKGKGKESKIVFIFFKNSFTYFFNCVFPTIFFSNLKKGDVSTYYIQDFSQLRI